MLTSPKLMEPVQIARRVATSLLWVRSARWHASGQQQGRRGAWHPGMPPSPRPGVSSRPMPTFVRARQVDNRPIVQAGAAPMDLCYFNLLRLAEGEQVRIHEPGFETVFVVL